MTPHIRKILARQLPPRDRHEIPALELPLVAATIGTTHHAAFVHFAGFAVFGAAGVTFVHGAGAVGAAVAAAEDVDGGGLVGADEGVGGVDVFFADGGVDEEGVGDGEGEGGEEKEEGGGEEEHC